MPRFRLRPSEVEAIQFNGNNWVEMANFTGTRPDGDGYQLPVFNKIGTFLLIALNPEALYAQAELWVEAQKGYVYVHIGDWIVKGANLDGVRGFNLIKDNTFQKLYEQLED